MCSIADGVINGANMDLPTVAGSTTYVVAKSREVVAVDNLRVKCAEFGIKIKYENKNIDDNKKNTKHYKKCC